MYIKQSPHFFHLPLAGQRLPSLVIPFLTASDFLIFIINYIHLHIYIFYFYNKEPVDPLFFYFPSQPNIIKELSIPCYLCFLICNSFNLPSVKLPSFPISPLKLSLFMSLLFPNLTWPFGNICQLTTPSSSLVLVTSVSPGFPLTSLVINSYLLVFLCQFFLLDQPPNAEEPNSRDLYPDPILFHPCVTLNTIHVSFISKSVPQAQTGSQTLMVTIFSWISKRYLKIRRSGRDQLVGHQVLFNTCLFIGCTRP